MAASFTKEQNALAQVMRADEEEAHRAFWWRLIPRVARVRALTMANMDKTRADDELASFTIQEREMMHGVLTNHVAQMNIILHCTGIATERRPSVDATSVRNLTLELEQQQEGNARRRQEFARLQQQEQEQEQAGRLH